MMILSHNTYKSERVTTICLTFVANNNKTVFVSRCPEHNDYTVIYGYSPKDRRKMGKTFFSADEMIAHYKTIRPELLEAMRLLNN